MKNRTFIAPHKTKKDFSYDFKIVKDTNDWGQKLSANKSFQIKVDQAAAIKGLSDMIAFFYQNGIYKPAKVQPPLGFYEAGIEFDFIGLRNQNKLECKITTEMNTKVRTIKVKKLESLAATLTLRDDYDESLKKLFGQGFSRFLNTCTKYNWTRDIPEY